MDYIQKAIDPNLVLNSTYTIEICSEIARMDIIAILKTLYKKNNSVCITQYSNDLKYIKQNSVIKQISYENLSETVYLQNKITVKGFFYKETIIETKEWADENDEILSFKNNSNKSLHIIFGPFIEEIHHMFKYNDDITIIIINYKRFLIKMEKHINFDAIMQIISLIFNNIHINFILTENEEENIKKQIKEANYVIPIFKYVQKMQKSMYYISNYSQTLPAILVCIDSNFYIFDKYNNIYKVNETCFKIENDYIKGLFYPNLSGQFFPLDLIKTKNSHNILRSENDALISFDEENNCYNVYTLFKNMYDDEIISNQFIRSFQFNKNTLPNFMYSLNAMKEDELYETRYKISSLITEQIVIKFQTNLDLNMLLSLNCVIKDNILCALDSVKDVWIADFFEQFLYITYNDSRPFIYELNDTLNNLSTRVIKNIELSDLFNRLNNTKMIIEEFHKNDNKIEMVEVGKGQYKRTQKKSVGKVGYYDAVSDILDTFQDYMRTTFYMRPRMPGSKKSILTNAWIKFWEIINTHDLIPMEHSDNYTVFCNSEFPGAFIYAIQHYIVTKTKNPKYIWKANSILEEKNSRFLGDSFELYKKYPKNWIMNDKMNGDITKISTIEYIKDLLNDSVDLYTGDIAIQKMTTEESLDQETFDVHMQLCQIICGLETLKNGGTLVCRMSLFFTPFTISLLRLLCDLFESFCITKPMTSRPTQSEIYIIGKNYKRDNTKTKLLIDKLLEKRNMNEFIVPITEDFYLKIVYIAYYIFNRQILFIEQNVLSAKSLYEISENVYEINDDFFERSEISKKELIYRKDIVHNWDNQYKVEMPKTEKEYI